MAARPVGIAVVGCGSTAHRRHLPVWRDLPGARLVAVASRDPLRRAEAARLYGAERAVGDWRELLADPAVDGVDICVPHPQHAEIARAMALAGKHILCEKPLAPTLAEAEEMARAAHASGVVLLPFLNLRLLGPVQTAISLVREGAIGRPRVVRGVMAHGGPDRTEARRAWFWGAESGGGAVLDLGPHMFDLVAQVVSSRPRRVRATIVRDAEMSVERDGFIEVEFEDGCVAQVHLSWSMLAARETCLAVQGDTGTLRVQLLLAPPPNPDAPPAPLVLSIRGEAGTAASYPEPGPATDPCALFVRAIQGERVALTAQSGVESVRYVDAAYRSRRAGGDWVPF